MVNPLTFLFGSGRRWEYKLVIVRLVLVAGFVGGMALLIKSPWKSLAAPLFWIAFVLLIGSIAYQYTRRWRDLQEERPQSRVEKPDGARGP